MRVIGRSRFASGVVGRSVVGLRAHRGVRNPGSSRIVLENSATAGNSPVGERARAPYDRPQVPRDT